MSERTMNRLRCVLFLAGGLLSLPLWAAEPAAHQPMSNESPVAIRAAFTADASGAGTLSLQATLAEGWHAYSLTEATEPSRTRITLAPSGQYHQTGAIRADVDPRRSYDPQSQRTVETHE